MLERYIKFLNTKSIDRVLVFANTPSYIYKHLKQESTVINLLKHKRFDELIADFDELLRMQEKEQEHFILIYAILFAIINSDDPRKSGYLSSLPNNTGIRWLKELIKIHFTSYIGTNNFHIQT